MHWRVCIESREEKGTQLSSVGVRRPYPTSIIYYEESQQFSFGFVVRDT